MSTVPFQTISIHAPRAGSDPVRPLSPQSASHFNPRSPCGERPHMRQFGYFRYHFNPRSPCGERHRACPSVTLDDFNFNPRSPCGERLLGYILLYNLYHISIHAPRAGSDSKDAQKLTASLQKIYIIVKRINNFQAVTSRNHANSSAYAHAKPVRTCRKNHVGLYFAFKGLTCPPACKCSYSQSAQSSSHIACRGNKNANCPSLCP